MSTCPKLLALALLLAAIPAQAQQHARTTAGVGLMRSMSPPERGWFETAARSVLAAINGSRAAAGLAACQPKHPVEIVPEKAYVTPLGLFPVKWGISLRCGRESQLVTFEPGPFVLTKDREEQRGERGEDGSLTFGASVKLVERGPSFVLLERNMGPLRSHTLAVGRIVDSAQPPPGRRTAGLLKPEAVTFFISSRDEGPPVLSWLDTVALASSLEALPPPPAVGGKKKISKGPSPSAEKMAASERQVFAWLLETKGAPGVKQVVNAETEPVGGKFSDQVITAISDAAPDIDASTLRAFAGAAKSAGRFPSNVVVKGTEVLRLERSEEDRFFAPKDEGKAPRPDGWKAFREVHGRTPIWTFSRVGFSADLSQAMVYVGWQSDWLAGAGTIYILDREGEEWRVLYEIPMWVS